jgi:serine/threonine protein kinase
VNEIRILASISHKNIIRYCDAFVEGDNLYIVMEMAEHGDIYRQIKKFKAANKYIKEDTIWSYAIQILQGLDHLHSRRILHRDIKPKNVFLTSKHHVRLGDLGCAKLMKTGLARTQIGTPYYMSPEIWAARPYDGKSDVWALGCLIYELCALHPPFLADDMNGLARKVKTTAAPRISKHYSDELATLVAQMLTKNPGQRPSIASILEMPCVASRMHVVPDVPSHDRAAAGGVLATIKVPRDLSKYKFQLALPDPSYPVSSTSSASDISKPSGRSASPIVSPSKRELLAKAGAVVADHRVPLTGRAAPSSGVRRVRSDAHMQPKRYGAPPSSRGFAAPVLSRPSSAAPSKRRESSKPYVPSRPSARQGYPAAAAYGVRARSRVDAGARPPTSAAYAAPRAPSYGRYY